MKSPIPTEILPLSPEAWTLLREAANTIHAEGNSYARSYVRELIRLMIAREAPSTIALQIDYVLSNVRARSEALHRAKTYMTLWAKAYRLLPHHKRVIAQDHLHVSP